MQYLAGLFAGVASSLIFWGFEKWILDLPGRGAVIGAVACFLVFGGLGFWASLKARQPKRSANEAGVRVGDGLRGRNVTVHVDGVTTAPGTPTDVVTNIEASEDIDASARNIKS